MSLSKLSKLALLAAVAATSRIALVAFPQAKPFLAIVVLTGIYFGGVAGALVGTVGIVSSNLVLGMGTWTVFQAVGVALVGAVSGVMRASFFLSKQTNAPKDPCPSESESPHMHRKKSTRTFVAAAFGGLAALFIYGPIVNIGSVIMFKAPLNLANILAFSLSGLPFDTIHAISTFAFVLVLSPLFSLLGKTR